MSVIGPKNENCASCTNCAMLHFWQEGTKQVTYTLNGSILKSKSSIKDLGIIINSGLIIIMNYMYLKFSFSNMGMIYGT